MADRCRRFGVAKLIPLVALALRAGVASGAVDMGGDWRVRIASTFIPGGLLELDFHVVQMGTTIDINGFAGSIDPDTGVFSATDSAVCPSTIAGVVDPSGATFSGSYTTGFVGSGGACALLPGDMVGSRCGNGVIDSGENCDDHNLNDGDCCDSSCMNQMPEGTTCSQGNTCEVRACSALGSCDLVATLADDAPCDDGLFCDGADQCRAGQCIVHAGNPCLGMPPCQNGCNETAESCVSSMFAPCPDEGNVCTADYCDGAGVCVHPPRANGFACADDGLACTGDYCDGAGTCIHPARPTGTICRFATSSCDVAERCPAGGGDCPADLHVGAGERGGCPTCEACDGGGSCAAMPQSSPLCRTSQTGDSVLAVHDRDGDHRDALKWLWRSAQATPLADFGNPDTGDAYALCAYDLSAPSPQLAFSAEIPAGGSCLTRPCWRRTQRSLRYHDRTFASDGLGSLLMRGGAQTRIALAARGATAPLPSLPAGLPLIVQLQSVDDASRCWQATYSQARTNGATVLRSTSD